MSPDSRRASWSGWIGAGALAASLAVVGLAAYRTSKPAFQPAGSAGRSGEAPRDSSLSLPDLSLGGSTPSRDPFQYLETPIPRKQPVVTAENQTQPVPELGALLYDTVNPQVQLRISGQASGWMSEGAAFHGWVVEAIRPDAVTVQKQGERIVLR